jgi:hypothetical protein
MNMTDRELEEMMREYDAEVAAYKRLPQSEPTALLDRAVLTKARAAVAHAPRPPRYLALAASFAGVALAAGIGWRVHVANEEARLAAMDSAPVREEVFEVDVMSGGTRDRQKALEMAQLPPPPPPPEPPAADAEQYEARKEAKAFAATAPTAEMPPASAPAPAVEAAAAPNPQRVSMPEPHLRADHATRGAAPEQRQNRAAAATAAAPADAAQRLEESSLKSLRDQREGESDTLGRIALSKDDAAEGLLSAEDWIKRIRRLLRERRMDEVRSELRRFHETYPDVAIPVDLRRYAP